MSLGGKVKVGQIYANGVNFFKAEYAAAGAWRLGKWNLYSTTGGLEETFAGDRVVLGRRSGGF